VRDEQLLELLDLPAVITLRCLLAIALSAGIGGCADVWGFHDLSGAETDGAVDEAMPHKEGGEGARDAGPLADVGGARDAVESDGSPSGAGSDASPPDACSPVEHTDGVGQCWAYHASQAGWVMVTGCPMTQVGSWD